MIDELHEEMANTQEYPAKMSFPHKYEDILKDFGTSVDTSFDTSDDTSFGTSDDTFFGTSDVLSFGPSVRSFGPSVKSFGPRVNKSCGTSINTRSLGPRVNKSCGTSINTCSLEKILSKLGEAGIFDPQKKRRFSVDEKGKNCFMLYARFLNITWGADSRYWTWYSDKATSDVTHDVAELLNVCWLEVQGDFEIGYLTPGTKYQVSFVIKMKDPAYGWEDEVDFSLTLPHKRTETRKCDLRDLPKGRWSYIPAGEFTPSRGQSGRMNFMLRQTVGNWKKGLVLEGVDIRPKT